jgi:uncharacterized protein (TIGR02266 family)
VLCDTADTVTGMTAASTTHKTVIIADDTPIVQERFTRALEVAGHRACTVRSAAELLARIRTDLTDIDLVVLSLRLPPAGGLDLVRAIRKLDAGRLPLVILSGTVRTAHEIRELADLGVTGYVNESSPDAHVLSCLAPHLFPDNFNRRRGQRAVLGIPVAYRHSNTIAAAVTLNLGKGGVAIRTMSPLDSNARARVRFRLPNSTRDVDVDGQVTWSDRRVGMGLQFDRIDPDDQQAIDVIVENRFAAKSGG